MLHIFGTSHRMRRTVLAVGALMPLVLALGVAPPAHAADVLGIIMDNSSKKAVVFDATTNSVIGSVSLPTPGGAVGDCNIVSGLGYGTDFNNKLDVVQLTPPALASGTNTIPISNTGEDVTWSPVTGMLYVSDGTNVDPLSIVNPTSRAQVGTFATGTDNNSVTAVGNSVIATSDNASTVRRFTPKGSTLADTGESLALTDEPNNVVTQQILTKPTDEPTALVITRNAHRLTSFTVPGLHPINTVTLPGTGFGASGVISPDGTRVFVRTATDVVGYRYNLSTGAIGSMLFDVAIPTTNAVFFGMEQLAVYPDGSKLFVSTANAVNVLNPTTGALITTITNANIVSPDGICLTNATE